jgi:flagellar biosynthesis/type III secretory pathway protein FliH
VRLKTPPARPGEASAAKNTDAKARQAPEPVRAVDAAAASFDADAAIRQIRREVEQEYADKFRVAGLLLQEAAKRKERALLEADILVLRMAFEIAKRILRSEPKINPEICIENVRQALRMMQAADSLTIWMHPADVAVLNKHEQMKREVESKAQRFTIKPRPDIEPGGCLLESENGVVDARIESQLAEIERLLNETTA